MVKIMKPLFAATLAASALFAWENAQAATIDFHVDVDTSAVRGTDGFLDFQFNPDGATSQDAVATLSNFVFTGGGSLAATSDPMGGGSGVLPATLTISNVSGVNDVFQGLTYGEGFGFDLSLSGPAVDAPVGSGPGSSFLVSLFDDAVFPLLTVDPFETVLTLVLDSSGGTRIQTFDADVVGSPSVVQVVGRAPQGVPEPEVVFLILFGLVYLNRLMISRRA